MRNLIRANKSNSMISQEHPQAGISVAIRQWALCTAAACALLLMTGTAPVLASDFTYKPSLAVSEEYNDNVFETRLNTRTDYITRIQPGVALKYNAPFWDWDLAYYYDYLYYAKGSRTDDDSHYVNGRGLIKLVDEVLFLELSDSYSRVPLDVTRDASNESLYARYTEQNTFKVSPYIVLHPTSKLTLKTGYRYINTWYKDDNAISTQNHVGFLSGEYEMSPKFFLTADYTFTRELPENDRNLYRHEAYIGPRYEYAEKSFVYAQGGFIAIDYDKFEPAWDAGVASGNNARPVEEARHTFDPAWKFGVTHAFDTVTVDLSTGTNFVNDPLGVSTMETFYRASLTKQLHRGIVTLQSSYSEFVDTVKDRTRDRRFSVGFKGEHEIMQDLRGSLGLTYENHEDLQLHGNTERYFFNSGLSYDFGNELTAGLYYKYSGYSSKEIAFDNYQSNRVILEVKKVF